MSRKQFVINILKTINIQNFEKYVDSFNNTIQDFGKSMDTITQEMSADFAKSQRESEAREEENKKNLEKIWGRKK